jgi:hypothetical protein
MKLVQAGKENLKHFTPTALNQKIADVVSRYS